MKIFDNLRGRAAIQGTADRFGQSPEEVRREIHLKDGSGFVKVLSAGAYSTHENDLCAADPSTNYAQQNETPFIQR